MASRSGSSGLKNRGPDIADTHPPRIVNLPPDTYTNYISAKAPGATTLILFDSLNTDRQYLTMARQQLLLYLSKMPPKTQGCAFHARLGASPCAWAHRRPERS